MGNDRFQSNRFESHKVRYDRDDPAEDTSHIAPNALSQEIKDEMVLFDAVRNYIRDNDVNEFEVAEHFGIPLTKVKDWIKNGRIEYREVEGATLPGDRRCFLCGKSISFGNVCTKCNREQSGKAQGMLAFKPENKENGKMRFNHDE